MLDIGHLNADGWMDLVTGGTDTCGECHKDSGSRLVCRECFLLLSLYNRTLYLKAWHRAIVTAAGN